MPFITAKDGAQLVLARMGSRRADPVPEWPRLRLAECGTTRSPPSPTKASAASPSTAAATAGPISLLAATTSTRSADDLATLVEDLDLTDLTLIAHSMAGGEAVRYLTRHGSHASRASFSSRADDTDAAQGPRQPERLADGSLRGLMGWVAPRLSEMGRRQPRPVLHSGDLARDDALGRRPSANLASVTLACSRAMVEPDFRAEMRAHRDSDPHRPRRPRPIDACRTHRQAFGRTHPRLQAPGLSGERRTASCSPTWDQLHARPRRFHARA